MNHLKGYPTAEAAMRSKAAQQPGARVDEHCPCGMIHVRQSRAPVAIRPPVALPTADLEPEAALALLSDYARSRIEIQPNGCWHWTGSIDSRGYGVANMAGGRRDAAHRHVYKQIVGEIPKEHLDHQCHNRDADCPGGSPCLHRRCVNPWHVVPATPGENVLRGKTPPGLNLTKDTCPEGHPYTHVDGRGWRKCKTCMDQKAAGRRRAAGAPERKLWQPACSHGHEFTPETTRWSKGNRYCKVCDAEKAQEDRPEKRKPCRGCGGLKEPGKAYAYCEECRKLRGASAPRQPVRRNTGPSAAVRKMVIEREGAACGACGTSVAGQPWSIQHRRARGMGGTSDAGANVTSNLVLLCGSATTPESCHLACENRDPDMHDRGFWLWSWEEPKDIPVMLASEHGSGITAWLTDSGEYAFAPPDEAAA